MQSIGVKTGTVEYKQLSDDIRATGTVDIDERLLSYVQVRFPGYIRKVFANATYQYVTKGEPLFTIYSPDLVATQQEYLLARQNQMAMSASLNSTMGLKYHFAVALNLLATLPTSRMQYLPLRAVF